jgi:hypothetical protein
LPKRNYVNNISADYGFYFDNDPMLVNRMQNIAESAIVNGAVKDSNGWVWHNGDASAPAGQGERGSESVKPKAALG